MSNEPERCWTIGCENEAVKSGYYDECADTSPSILGSDNESGSDESVGSDTQNPIEDGSGDANHGFEAGGPTVHDQRKHDQGHAAVATQHAPDERGQREGAR